MNSFINLLIALLIVGWLVGYFGFAEVTGSLIHLLLVVAVIGIAYRLFERGRKRKDHM